MPRSACPSQCLRFRVGRAPLVPDAAAGRRRRAAIVRSVGISGGGASEFGSDAGAGAAGRQLNLVMHNVWMGVAACQGGWDF